MYIVSRVLDIQCSNGEELSKARDAINAECASMKVEVDVRRGVFAIHALCSATSEAERIARKLGRPLAIAS